MHFKFNFSFVSRVVYKKRCPYISVSCSRTLHTDSLEVLEFSHQFQVDTIHSTKNEIFP